MEDKIHKKAISKKKQTKEQLTRKKYLPIGTVISLKGAQKRIFITGFCVKGNSDKDKIWDYCGYLYPEGNIRTDLVCMFNHSQIEKIYHLGYESEEEKEFNHKLRTYMKSKKA